MAPYEKGSGRAKRRKIQDDFSASSKPFTISSHNQLKGLLVFKQSDSQEVKQGFIQFKEFLNSINQEEEEDEKSKKFQILNKYCDSQYREGDEENESSCFPEIMQTWNFADTSNNESLLSTIPSVLALFLKTISSRLEFRDFGLSLCRFMLLKEQLKLLNRGLTAGKSKEHLISPCIRLLTEIVSFDGGTVAQATYAKQDITFKRFDGFLVPRKVALDEEEARDLGRPTLRRIAQRYVLANFKFQNAAAKDDIIGQGKIIRAFLEDIRRDSRDIVIDIIRTLDKHIISDSSLNRHVKSRFLNRWNLERLVTLYGFEKGFDETEKNDASVSDETHKFLMKVCTDPEKGILLPETGWYPSGSNPDTLLTDGEGIIDLGLDSPAYLDKYQQSVPVRNGNLSSLARVLRPESDTLQMQLVLEIFKAAPELVAEFFSKRTMFTADPKPTPSWLGESAFLFSTVQLDVPENLGWKSGLPAMPPPVSIVIESIFPRPLTQKVLTRCLNQNTDVVTLFAIRIVTIAFRKLQKVLKTFHSDREVGQSLWNQAASKLLAEFSRRCPTMKDVVSLFRQTAKDNLQQQEALAELLSLYYEVVPTVAFEEKFDVSLTLVEVLRRLDDSGNSADDTETLLSLLQHILGIARQSPSMRWWQKPESLGFSAFTSILKALIAATSESSSKQIHNLLNDVLVENTVLLPQRASFNSLVASLKASDADSLPAQLSFFDNCVTRLVKKPVMYQEAAASLVNRKNKDLSPVMATIVEQWPFVVKKGDPEAEKSVADFISRLIGYLKQAGDDKEALTKIRDSMLEATDNKPSRSFLKKALKFTRDDVRSSSVEPAGDSSSTDKSSHQHPVTTRPRLPDLAEVFGALPKEDLSHNALNRWERDEIEVALERGHIGNLMFCLCSEHQEIRIQASAGISRFMAKLKESTFKEWQAIYVLCGEVVETVNEFGFYDPFPTIAAELAARSILVLNTPLHKVYGKVNKFLNKGPVWEIGKIPSYWIDKILLHEPDYDDGHLEEVEWLLDLLISGLRSESDMDIYRRANVFERFLTLYHSPGLTKDLRKKVLHLLVRAIQVGGSTTLLTRVAVMSWVGSQASSADPHEAILRRIAQDLYEYCDQERVNKWSTGAMSKAVSDIVEVNVQGNAALVIEG